jgi:hypothetical protein
MHIAIVCNIGPEGTPTSFRDRSGKNFSFRAICAKTAQKKVSKALPAMESPRRTIREGAKPHFPGVPAICNLPLWRQFKKLFLANFQ